MILYLVSEGRRREGGLAQRPDDGRHGERSGAASHARFPRRSRCSRSSARRTSIAACPANESPWGQTFGFAPNSRGGGVVFRARRECCLRSNSNRIPRQGAGGRRALRHGRGTRGAQSRIEGVTERRRLARRQGPNLLAPAAHQVRRAGVDCRGEDAGLRRGGAVLARTHLLLQGLPGGKRFSRLARRGELSSARAQSVHGCEGCQAQLGSSRNRP